MTIPELLEKSVRQAPDLPMIIFEKEEVTYRQMLERSCLVAGNLKAQGIQPGDKIALMMGNCLEYLYCFMGCGRIGALLVPINPALSFEEFAYIIQNSEARFLIIMAQFRPVLPRLFEALPNLEKVFILGESCEHSSSFSELLQPVETPDIVTTEASDAALIYTSGTTGKPKGVILTHGNYAWDTLSLLRSNRITSRDRFLCVLPLFHVNAQVVSILTPTLCNATIILVGGTFTPYTILPLIEQHKITIMSAVPTIYGLMTRLPKAETTDVSSIRFFVSGAAPMPEAIYEAVQRVFKKPLIMGYGLSEATCQCCCRPRRPHPLEFCRPRIALYFHTHRGQKGS